MSASESAILIMILGGIGGALVLGMIYAAATSIMLFAAFVNRLPLLLSILLFIVFPPALLVFLLGNAMMAFGVGEALFPTERTAEEPTNHAPPMESEALVNQVENSFEKEFFSEDSARYLVLLVVILVLLIYSSVAGNGP